MAELLATLLPILVVDFLNPVLLALLVFAAATDRPVGNSTALLLGHTVAYFLAGILISFGVEQISEVVTDRLKNPKSIDFAIGLVVGIWCLVWAAKPNKKRRDEPDMPDWKLTPLKCFLFGAVVNFIGVPFAVPYIAAVDQILKADLSMQASVLVLVIYNVCYALPFAIVPGSVLLMGDRAKPMLNRLNEKMVAFMAAAMPWFIGLLGVWMVFESVYYYVAGKPLY